MSSPVGDIARYTREGLDLDEDCWKVSLYVWDSGTLDWVRMTQPLIDATNSELYLKVDDLEQYILDQLQQYKLSNFDTSADPIYLGYLNKSGAWYIKQITLSTGAILYAAGASGYAAAWADASGQSYDLFSEKF